MLTKQDHRNRTRLLKYFATSSIAVVVACHCKSNPSLSLLYAHLSLFNRQSRLATTVLGNNTQSFLIDPTNKSYKHQYANIYFIRLRLLRGHVESAAENRWKGIAGNPVLIPRVLEVVKSQLCYILGTVYMDMPLKPNILEDIARDVSTPTYFLSFHSSSV